MTIVIDRPPNFEQILAAFPGADKPGVIFAFGDAIYNPSSIVIPPALIAHESVHLERQRALEPPKRRGPAAAGATQWSGAELWWGRYLEDPEFRYHEELLAHAAEFKALKVGDRNFCAGLLVRTAARLTAPLYNYTPPRTMQQALKDLKHTVEAA